MKKLSLIITASLICIFVLLNICSCTKYERKNNDESGDTTDSAAEATPSDLGPDNPEGMM